MRNAPGFTLIELLIVVVVLGVLAAIALPKFGTTREAAFYSTMKQDLNNLRSAQETYYQMSGDYSYASTLDQLEFEASSAVSMGTISLLNGGQAWEVAATHRNAPDAACVLGFGEVGSASWGASAGDPVVEVTDANAGAPVCND